MMRIVHIIPRFTTGGAERLVLRYARAQSDAGAVVSVASVRGGGDLLTAFRDEGIVTRVYDSLVGIFRFFLFVRRDETDVIHSHVFSADAVAFVLKIFLPKIVWVSTQHNVAIETSFFRRFIVRYILRWADTVIAVSPVVEISCLTVFRVTVSRCVLIENGIDLTVWSYSGDILNEDMVHIASIGRLTEQKGQKYLLEALVELSDFNWKLTLYGTGPDEKKLRMFAESSGIGDRVNFAGVMADIPDAMSGIDIVVQPSLWEGRSLVIMEAMSAGRLVIASVPAGDDMIRRADTGYIVLPKDSHDIAKVLDHAIRNRAESQWVACRGREYAVTHFGDEESLSAIWDVYVSHVQKN
jgi:glycosyltransferase involved in cell wall biosynthesis